MDNTYIDTNRKNSVIMVSRLLYDGHKKHLLKAKMSTSLNYFFYLTALPRPGINFFLRIVRYFLKLPKNHKPICSKQNKLTLLFLFFSNFSFSQVPHCGFDFTSYLVVLPHENGNSAVINDLQITVVDENGNEVIITENTLSWIKKDKALSFDRNYLISKPTEKERWFFPYANESYFLSVTNTFPADNYSIQISDPKGIYKTQTIQLQLTWVMVHPIYQGDYIIFVIIE